MISNMPLDINYTTGYAGTGKSTQLIAKVNSLPIESTVVIAPTHKALARLRGSLPLDLEIKTIQSLLGWIPRINEQAEHITHIDVTHKLDKPLDEYSDIVIDEAGMMSEDMLYDIVSKIEAILYEYESTTPEAEPTITLHCYLDPYQLLPVKGRQIQTDPLTTTNLTTQYRAESTDVVALYTKFVHYIEGLNGKDLTTPYSDNVRPLDISNFNAKNSRLLAYTNEAVGNWNKLIAKQLGITSYEGQEVQLGNMLDTVNMTSFIEPSLSEVLDLYATSRLVLQNSQINKNFLEESLKALIDNEHIKFIEDINGRIYPVVIGIGHANKVIKSAKEEAIKNKSRFKEVYALGRAFTMDYTFATTVHKSQGSEFSIVYIDKEDIKKSIRNNYYDTYARLMYVAISRCKKLLYI